MVSHIEKYNNNDVEWQDFSACVQSAVQTEWNALMRSPYRAIGQKQLWHANASVTVKDAAWGCPVTLQCSSQLRTSMNHQQHAQMSLDWI